MKLVQTLVVGDEAEVAEAQLAYHLGAGVDFIIAFASAGPSEILERYEREGHVRVMRDAADADARTHMARLAATEHNADWVINARANEFWWPRGESLKEILAPIPPRYTIVQALRRELYARPGAEGPFAERMTLRRSLQDGRPAGPPQAQLRPIHRGHPDVVVDAEANVSHEGGVPLRAWYPIEVLELAGPSQTGGDRLVEDTRLRDALRSIRASGSFDFRTPDVVEDAAYAVDCAAVGEVDLPRLEAYISELEQRIAWLEERFWPRVLRSASGLVRRRRP